MKKYIGASLLLTMAALWISCEKATESGPEMIGEAKSNLISCQHYYLDGGWYLEKYDYSPEGKLLTETQFRSSGEKMYETRYKYEGNLLKAWELGWPREAAHRFSYVDGRLYMSAYIEYQAYADTLFTRTYEYEDDRLVKITETGKRDGRSVYNILTYTDDNITGIQTYDYRTDELTNHIVLEYDGRVNPFYHLRENVGNIKYASKNNLLRMYKVLQNSNASAEKEVYEYEYDNRGYPLIKYLILEDGRKLKETVYNYKKP